jgi:hypothetical protein
MLKGYDGVSLLGAFGMGMCPVLAATVLISIGLGVAAPFLMWLSGAFLIAGMIIYALDYRCHRQIAPMTFFAAGSLLLWAGRYSVLGGTGLHAWPIWGSGSLLVLAALVFNLRARRICVIRANTAIKST